MNKLISVLQLTTALVLCVAAIATIINLVLISTRPDTVSVLNVLVGQGILIICLLVISRILLRKGLIGLRDPNRDNGSNTGAE